MTDATLQPQVDARPRLQMEAYDEVKDDVATSNGLSMFANPKCTTKALRNDKDLARMREAGEVRIVPGY